MHSYSRRRGRCGMGGMGGRAALATASVAVGLGLAGCTTPQDQAAHMQAQVERMMAVYGPACAQLGYTAGSDAWRGCVLHLSTKDDLQRYGPYGPYDGWHGGHWRNWAP